MSFDLVTPTPLADAIKHLSAKTPIGSILRTAEWGQMPEQLQQTGQFSAGVESVRVMDRVQSSLMDLVTNAREEAKGRRKELGLPGVYKMDRQKFRTQIRTLAKEEGITAAPGEEGTLKDFTSTQRLDLIFTTQTKSAQGYAYYKRGQDEEVLNAWPAQELVRRAPRKHPRGSDGKTQGWPERWVAAGGKLVEGRMVALKTDPIWQAISRFRTPWPAFDFNSGMGLKEIEREDAIDLGLLTSKTKLKPSIGDFNASLEASVKGVDPRFVSGMKKVFGDQIKVEGDLVRWARPAVEANRGEAQ